MKIPIYGKIKRVPNHQSVKFWYRLCRWNLNNISIIWIMVSQLWCSSSARHILNHPNTIRARVGRLRFIGLHRNEGFWDFGRSNPIENLLGSWNFLRILSVTHIKTMKNGYQLMTSILNVISRHFPFWSPFWAPNQGVKGLLILSHPRMNRPHKFVPRHLNHAWSRLCCPAQHDLSLSTHESVDHWDKNLELVKRIK